MSLNNVAKGRRFAENSIVFLRETFNSYEAAKKAAVENKKANIWIKNTIICTYNISYGFLERISEDRHEKIQNW